MIKEFIKILEDRKCFILGLILIIIGILIFTFNNIIDYKNLKVEEEKINNFFQQEVTIKHDDISDSPVDVKEEDKTKYNDHYVAIIEIPTINLKKGLFDINSKYNNVNYNIQILKESNMPNIKYGNFILAGHSGSGSIAYFDRLVELKYGDEVYIYYDNIKYIYKVSKIYEIEKTGTTTINRNTENTNLTMITCKENSNKQIIVISDLLKEESY